MTQIGISKLGSALCSGTVMGLRMRHVVVDATGTSCVVVGLKHWPTCIAGRKLASSCLLL
jgi:hypothetical protein